MKIIEGVRENTQIEAEELGTKMGEEVKIHGSVYKIRKMSGFAFVLLRTKRQILQCTYTEEKAGIALEEMPEESCVELLVHVKEEARSKSGFDLVIKGVQVLSKPEEMAPIVINQKRVDTSMEKLLDYRPITLRNERERAIFKIQEGIVDGFRKFLKEERFTEIHTPKIVHAGAEGGANIFQLNYFGKDAYLAQSPQFYKQMMVGVYERVFEIAAVYRAEKHDTSRHLNEYTSVDFEMGYIKSYEEIMELETRLLRAALAYLRENNTEELELLKVELPEITSIPAISFREAKELVASEFQREIREPEDLEPEEERLLCQWVKEQTGSEFVFVTHYPSKKRPFYAMECEVNREETKSFDLLFRGLEITTGGQRIHSYQEQLTKMEKRGMDVSKFESYLMMHRYGMPPHGGLGLGLERFTSRLLRQDNVRLSTLFPRDINRLEP